MRPAIHAIAYANLALIIDSDICIKHNSKAKASTGYLPLLDSGKGLN